MKLLTAKEVAELLRADKRTIERRAFNGYYPSEVCGKHGRYWLFNEEKLLQYIFKST